MERAKHQRFVAANRELRDFLRRTEGIAGGAGAVSEAELKVIWLHLVSLAPEIEGASSCETLDADLQEEIAAYVKNLRELQRAIETIRCVMLARNVELQAAKRHLDGLRGWVQAYQRTM
jgi:hypothetical protein